MKLSNNIILIAVLVNLSMANVDFFSLVTHEEVAEQMRNYYEGLFVIEQDPLFAITSSNHSPNPKFFEILKNSTCTNLDQVLTGLKWTDRNVNPYVTNPHGTMIPRDEQCYIIIENPEDDFNNGASLNYSLHDMTAEEAQVSNQTVNTYLTHNFTCGACSTLEDLNVFLTQKDLTSPVKACIMKTLPKFWYSAKEFRDEIAQCFQDTLGFTDMCSVIWQYNSANTKSHCEFNCLIQEEILNVPHNVPVQRSIADTNYCDPKQCQQTINGKNACSDFQWQNGPYRLNSCIQCDECNSGPVFQKFSGRTRRDTGITSAIKRPEEQKSHVDHYYGI